ncbi:ATP-binding protein [Streptomyces olivoreticuli]
MTGKEKGPSQASLLVDLARSEYDLLVSEDGRPYGVRRRGPNVVLPLRGKVGLRAWLARQFTEAHGGQVPSQAALADAMTVLEGMASATDPVEVHLRVAGGPERIVLDLGTADGRCVIVTADGWEIAERSPVLFRRSGAMAPMPVPERHPDGLALLRDLLNMDDAAFRQLVAWLVAAWLPHIPHTVLTCKGEQGTGKSKAAQMIINLVDPSPATKRAAPRDAKTWAVQAFNSWAMCLDNVSGIPPWLSDTLCKAVTGDADLARALYSDDDLVVLAFRRVLAMTTIDAGALAGDLADRVLILELQLITDDQRRTEEELDAAYLAARPAILGALLDLLAAVLRELPTIQLAHKPRMADWARVMAAVDRVQGWNTLGDYRAAALDVAADALAGDPFGAAVAAFVDTHGPWTGTASQLLDLIPPPETYDRNWPKDVARAGGRLRRLAPALRAVGINVGESRSEDRRRTRFITLTPQETGRKILSAPSVLSTAPADQRIPVDSTTGSTVRTVHTYCPQPSPADGVDSKADSKEGFTVHAPHPTDQGEHTPADSTDGADSKSPHISGPYLLCAACQKPMDPALTQAGHLTHPHC